MHIIIIINHNDNNNYKSQLIMIIYNIINNNNCVTLIMARGTYHRRLCHYFLFPFISQKKNVFIFLTLITLLITHQNCRLLVDIFITRTLTPSSPSKYSSLTQKQNNQSGLSQANKIIIYLINKQ